MITPVDIIRSSPSTSFLSGIYFATFVASALIFFKFWRRTRSRFFQYFGFACLALAIERIPLLFLDPIISDNSWVYLFRLSAFTLIMAAVIDTNRNPSGEA